MAGRIIGQMVGVLAQNVFNPLLSNRSFCVCYFGYRGYFQTKSLGLSPSLWPSSFRRVHAGLISL